MQSSVQLQPVARESRPRDADPTQAARASLRRSGYAALRLVNCDAHGDRVTLHGNVPTYHLKQLAQEFVQRVVGGRRVVNEIAVGRPVDQRASS
jgi:osmotically-inducible protein OsmY